MDDLGLRGAPGPEVMSMQCHCCGSRMDFTKQTTDKDRVYVWYVCSRDACRRELLHVQVLKPGSAEAAGG